MQNVDAGSLGLYGLPFRLIRKMRHKYDRDLIKNEDPAKYNREILDVMRTKNDRAPSRKNKKRQVRIVVFT